MTAFKIYWPPLPSLEALTDSSIRPNALNMLLETIVRRKAGDITGILKAKSTNLDAVVVPLRVLPTYNLSLPAPGNMVRINSTKLDWNGNVQETFTQGKIYLLHYCTHEAALLVAPARYEDWCNRTDP